MLNRKKHIYFIFFLIIFSFLWWLFYLLYLFPKKYHVDVNEYIAENSGIVVLTGGKGRFEKGLTLLKNGVSDKLFVSGVYPGVDLKKKYFSENAHEIKFFECCISSGNQAINTTQNAYEVKDWVEEKKIKVIFLVSSYYHLPRSKIIFDNILSDKTIKLVTVDDNYFESNSFLIHMFNLKLIIIEYIKILYITLFGI